MYGRSPPSKTTHMDEPLLGLQLPQPAPSRTKKWFGRSAAATPVEFKFDPDAVLCNHLDTAVVLGMSGNRRLATLVWNNAVAGHAAEQCFELACLVTIKRIEFGEMVASAEGGETDPATAERLMRRASVAASDDERLFHRKADRDEETRYVRAVARYKGPFGQLWMAGDTKQLRALVASPADAFVPTIDEFKTMLRSVESQMHLLVSALGKDPDPFFTIAAFKLAGVVPGRIPPLARKLVELVVVVVTTELTSGGRTFRPILSKI